MLSSPPSRVAHKRVLWHLAVVILASQLCVPASAQKIGFGYRLVSIGKSPDGRGLLGYLQVKQATGTYGADIPRLKLFVKYVTCCRCRFSRIPISVKIVVFCHFSCKRALSSLRSVC